MGKAQKVLESFTGKPAAIVAPQLPPAAMKPKTTYQIGRLFALEVITQGTRQRVEFGAGAKLLLSKYGALYCYDKKAGLPSSEYVTAIEYQAYDGNKLVNYKHDFEKQYPWLQVRKGTGGRMARIAGGKYKFSNRGILG